MKLSLEEDIECPKCHKAGGLCMWEKVQGYMHPTVTLDTEDGFEDDCVYHETAEIDETVDDGVNCDRCQAGFSLDGTNISEWSQEAYEAQCKRAEKKERETNPKYAVRKLSPQEKSND